MATISVKIIHPTNNSEIDIPGVPDDITIRAMIEELIKVSFLPPKSSYYYAVNRSQDNKYLDNEKTFSENGVDNNDTLLLMIVSGVG